jgi:NADP-dependent 3-hydroxy acid dehydrogenase YdfG
VFPHLHKESLGRMQSIYDKFDISPERIDGVVAFAMDQPEDTTINEFTVGAANQSS